MGNSQDFMGSPPEAQAATVCVPCKRRKKRCDKGLPSCSRCSRFNTHCSYPVPVKRLASPPTLSEVVPEFATRSTGSSSSGTLKSSPTVSNYGSLSLSEVAAFRIRILVDYISPKGAEDYSNYFANFHKSLPIINEEDFYWRLRNSSPSQSLSGLMLAMSLVAQLSSRATDAISRANDIYHTLKGVYTYCQSIGTPSIELLQAGILVASYEHCQALHQEAWLTIGACARLSQILRQQQLGSERCSMPDEQFPDYKSPLWWAIVVLERIISADYMENKLPLVTESPKLDDLLPMTSPANERGHTVGYNLFLAEDIERNGKFELRTSSFTTLSPFAAIIQATYLSSLVTQHVFHGAKDPVTRQSDSTRLDLNLAAYAGALIPPPGKAAGHFCGAYGIRTCAHFYLHQTELDVSLDTRNDEQTARSKIALQSLTRTVIHSVRAADTGIPLDIDSLAFWAHKIVYLAALCHIKYGVRDNEWESDLEVCKSYLRYFVPRIKLHSNYLREIEREEQKMSI